MRKKKIRKVEIVEEVVFETRRVVCRDAALALTLGLMAADGERQAADGGMRPWERRVVAALVVVWFAV